MKLIRLIRSFRSNFALAFYQAMLDNGFPVDILGFSYFPSAFDSTGDSVGLMCFQYTMNMKGVRSFNHRTPEIISNKLETAYILLGGNISHGHQ